MKAHLFSFLRRAALAVACLTCSLLVHAQTFPPAWTSTATYAPGDIVQYGGNWYRAMKALATHGPYPASAYGSWELNYIRSNTTITIGDGQGFANLVFAWAFAHNARIADAAYLHFSIVTTRGSFNENFAAPFSLDHNSGALVSINGDNPANIHLNFSASALTIDTNHAFGTISGLTIQGSLGVGQGIFADSGTVYDVSNCIINQFATSVEALQNSAIYVDGSVQIADPTAYGLYANQGGSIEAGAFSFFVNIPITACLYANYNGTISCLSDALAGYGERGSGALAENGGVINVTNCAFSDWNNACAVDNGGRIVVSNGSFSGCGADLAATQSGTINASGTSSPDGNIGGTGSDGSWIYQ